MQKEQNCEQVQPGEEVGQPFFSPLPLSSSPFHAHPLHCTHFSPIFAHFRHVCLLTPLLDLHTWKKLERKHLLLTYTVEPRFKEPLFNEVLDITNENLRPCQNYSKMYGIEPPYNESRRSEFLDITNIIRKPKRKIYLDIMNHNVNTWLKISAEQINSQQIL